MKIWQLVCGSALVLSMTSCGNKEAATPPVEKPPATEAAPVTTGAAPTTPEAAPATTEAAPATTGTAPATTGAAPATTEAAPPVKKAPATATAKKSSTSPVKKAPATEATEATSTATGPGFQSLKTIIGTTKKAGEAANFDLATTEFSKFEDAWKTVEDKVKAKKPADYKAIEASLEAANMAIAKKDKTALLTSLTKLSGSVDKASK